MTEKARLNRRFLERRVAEYNVLRREVDTLTREVGVSDVRRGCEEMGPIGPVPVFLGLTMLLCTTKCAIRPGDYARKALYQDSIAAGTMALVGEKHGDVVRVVQILGPSVKLCGLGAYEFRLTKERALAEVAERLKVNAVSPEMIAKRLDVLLAEKRALEKKLEEALKGGGAQGGDLLAGVETVAGVQFLSKTLKAETMKDLQALGDVVRERLGSGVGVLVADFGDDKGGLVVVVTDDLCTKGITAGGVMKALAAKTGIRGGGKDHMAQAGLSGEQVGTVPGLASEIILGLLEGAK